MPSPFPGMDPYLEDPRHWPDVHHELISVARALLNPLLRPKYHARIEERVYISDEADPGREVLVPDLQVVERPTGSRPLAARVGGNGPELGVTEPIVVVTLHQEEVREARIEILDVEGRSVVTVIEILSPSNKVAASRGQASFQEKRTEVMNSPSHWVEIDLLRGGSPIPARRRSPSCEYLVHISTAEQRPRGQVWPIRLPHRLPVIPIPLRPEDPAVPLDLQLVLNTAYDRAGYDQEMDYAAEPRPPLNAEWSAWSDRLLKDKGLR